MPNSNATTQKETIDEKIVPEATLPDDSDNKPNQKLTSESPITTIPEELPTKSEVKNIQNGNNLKILFYSIELKIRFFFENENKCFFFSNSNIITA